MLLTLLPSINQKEIHMVVNTKKVETRTAGNRVSVANLLMRCQTPRALQEYGVTVLSGLDSKIRTHS